MNIESVFEALRLLAVWDRELAAITANSLRFAIVSTAIAALIGIPPGVLLAFREFPGRRAVIAATHTLMGLPTVVAGLLVFSLLSRAGPLGRLGLMFTPTAVIIGQAVLGLPIVISLVYSGLSRLEPELAETLLTLGATRFQRTVKIVREGRVAVASAILTAFGRVVGEVGTAMMLGGNIRWYTRTITTAIALETQKGAFAMSVALGMVLMAVAFGVNFGLNYLIRFRPGSRFQ
ncbi:MAG: ABC transporter permease subunit [Spirochaetaceae bacterium]|nr:MAG: ABC transporter permease subunit [Spirochaetaceae bacterium]